MAVYILLTPHYATQHGVISFEAENDTVAWFVCLHLGHAIYTVERADGRGMFPSSCYNLYGSQKDADAWLAETFGDLPRWKHEHMSDVIEAFDSFMYTKPNQSRDDAASLLAHISTTPTYGNDHAEKIVAMARKTATSLANERLSMLQHRPEHAIDTEYFRNFGQHHYTPESLCVADQ